jgi:hypothetical protein
VEQLRAQLAALQQQVSPEDVQKLQRECQKLQSLADQAHELRKQNTSLATRAHSLHSLKEDRRKLQELVARAEAEQTEVAKLKAQHGELLMKKNEVGAWAGAVRCSAAVLGRRMLLVWLWWLQLRTSMDETGLLVRVTRCMSV